LGNEAGFTELDFMEYFERDNDTKALLMYLEKVTDGPKFIELAKRITAIKPVVLIKAGRSARGSAAVMSHTGSLISNDAVFTAACRECGIITVDSLRELFNFAKLFHIGVLKPLKHLAIITNGGGPSVVAADLIDLSRSLELAELPAETRDALGKVLPPMAATGNPVDIIGDATSKRYDDALKILIAEKSVDGIIVILTPQMMTDAQAAANVLVSHEKGKPVIPVFMGGESIQKGAAVLQKNGWVNFDFSKDVVEALDSLSLTDKRPLVKIPMDADAMENIRMADFPITLELLSDYDIKIPGVLLKNKDELAATFEKFKNQQLAMKVISTNIVHKTDTGGVRLNLATAEEAEEAWDDIMKSVKTKNPEAKIQGMFVQPIVAGKEVIVGMKRDPVFGPAIIFGLGGIFVEVLKDTSLRIAPVNNEEARRMIEEIKGYAILSGLRGEKPVDIDALVKIIVAISKLSLAHQEIKEIDLNPVIVDDQIASVVDARIIL
jgi:acetyltransferase